MSICAKDAWLSEVKQNDFKSTIKEVEGTMNST